MKQEEEKLKAENKDPNRLTIRELLAIKIKEAALKAEKAAKNVSNEQ